MRGPDTRGASRRGAALCVRAAVAGRDRDAVGADRNAVFELELFLQTQRALEPFRAFLRITHRQSEMTDDAYVKWSLHRSYISVPTEDRLRKLNDG